jgi:cation:H+ antiporter
MTMAVLSLLAGVVLAGLGGELFLRGVLGFARVLRIPAAIAAATLGAFATSSPEVFVSTIAAAKGEPAIGLGDATGSNVVNIALILAMALLIRPLATKRATIGLDYTVAIGASGLIALLALDGVLSRLDGVLLLAGFSIWMGLHIRSAARQRSEPEPLAGERPWLIAVQSIVGMALLIAAGTLVVGGATTIAQAFGVPAFLIGATLVALGTSMPEFATVLVAVLRGHDEVGVGTLLGSNVFNALFIVGIAATITPIPVTGAALWIALGAGALAAACTWPGRTELLGRLRGVLLIALYGVTLSLLAVFAG